MSLTRSSTALNAQRQLAGEEHRPDFYAVLTCFRAYSPQELSALWLHGDLYRPQKWLERWQINLPETNNAIA